MLDLVCRFEPPSPLTRWDTPLFRICPVENEDLYDDGKEISAALRMGLNKTSAEDVACYKEVPFDEIWESLTVTKQHAKHLAINPPVKSVVRIVYEIGGIVE